MGVRSQSKVPKRYCRVLKSLFVKRYMTLLEGFG